MNTDAVTDAERLAVAQSVSGRADATNYAFWTDPATRMFIDALCLARRQVAALEMEQHFSNAGWITVAGALMETYAGGPSNLPACVAHRVTTLAETNAALNGRVFELRADNARLTAEVERLREAFLIVPLQCDCGDTIKQYTDHAADCPYGIRERALAVPK